LAGETIDSEEVSQNLADHSAPSGDQPAWSIMLVLFTGLAESRQSAIMNHDALIILEPTPFELWSNRQHFLIQGYV